MKKIGLTLLIALFISGLMVQGVQARWHGHNGGGWGHGHYRGWGGSGIYLGVPLVVGRPWYPYGYYPQPPVVVQQTPVYVEPQKQEDDYYWYYCQNPKGYYPYIKSCRSGWMKVVPDTDPQATPPN